MKTVMLFLIGIGACLTLQAQTTNRVFSPLLATNSTVLMTNAEFRTILGRRLTFKDGFDLEAYDVTQLHPSVLQALNIDKEKAIQDQADRDAASKAYLNQTRSQAAQALQAAQAAQAAQDAAAAAAAAQAATNGAAGGSPDPGSSKKHHRKAPTQ